MKRRRKNYYNLNIKNNSINENYIGHRKNINTYIFKKQHKNKIMIYYITIIFFIGLTIALIIMIMIFYVYNLLINYNNKLNKSNQDIKNIEINKTKNENNEINLQKTNNNIKVYKQNKTYEKIEKNNITYKSMSMQINEQINNIKKYIKIVTNAEKINSNEIFYKSENPKISIVISVYNGEGYLKTALLSIQKQNFKDVEIIIVDDCSKDNSVNLIKELMVKDKRIIFLQNEENRGALYTKTKGVLNSKGKYVMILDEDDMYVQENAFATLYGEAEKNNLDILGFTTLITNIRLEKKILLFNYIQTPILFQPRVSYKMYAFLRHGKIKRVGSTIWNYFFKTELFIKVIKQIDDKFMNVKMNVHDDYLLFFLLTRNAYNLKKIRNIFYLKLDWEDNNAQIKFQLQEKNKDVKNLNCLAYLNYIEFLLMKTKDINYDKKIASFELKNFYLNHECRNNTFIREKGINLSKSFLENKYIDNDIKDEILNFINETKNKI